MIRIEFTDEQGTQVHATVADDDRWVEVCERFEKRAGIVADPAEQLRQARLLAQWKQSKPKKGGR